MTNRLVDYFFVCGLDTSKSSIDPYYIKNPNDVSIEHIRLKPRLISQYPIENYSDCELPSELPSFCFPDGGLISKSCGLPEIYPFVLTAEDGEKMYASCLHFGEALSDEKFAELTNFLEELKDKMTEEKKNEDTTEDDVSEGDLDSEKSSRSSKRKKSVSSVASDDLGVDITIEGTGKGKENERTEEEEEQKKAVVEEKPKPVVITPKRPFYIQKSFGVVSHYPFFSLFKVFLTELYRISLTPSRIPIERYITNFCCEIPLPPKGKIQVKYTIGDKSFFIKRNPPNRLKSIYVDMELVFDALSLETILLLFNCVLMEMQILLVSKHITLLNTVLETITSLLFPFQWQHVYIPVLSRKCVDFIQAPVPFLMGCLDCFIFDTSKPQRVLIHPLPKNVVVFDLDKDGFINVPPTFSNDCPRLPERQRTKLITTLQTELFEKCRFKRKPLLFLDSAFDMAPTPLDDFDHSGKLPALPFPEEKIRKAFLRFFTSIFQKYRQFMIHPDEKSKNLKDSKNPENPLFCEFEIEKFFKKNAFLKEASTDSCKIFMGKMLETQCFTKFLLDRLTSQNTQEITFFDESIDAKTNRSKLKIYKKETPFLNDSSLKIENTVIGIEPDETNIPVGPSDKQPMLFMYPEFPEIDPKMCNPPRATKQLVSMSEVQKNNNHVFQSWKTILVMLWTESRQMESNNPVKGGFRFNGTPAVKKMLPNPSLSSIFKNPSTVGLPGASNPQSAASNLPAHQIPTQTKQFPRLAGQQSGEYNDAAHLRSISFGEIDFDVSEFDSEFSDIASQNEHVLTETGQVIASQRMANSNMNNIMGKNINLNVNVNSPNIIVGSSNDENAEGEAKSPEMSQELLETNNVLKRLSFDSDEECPNPGCKKKLAESEVRAGWGTDANDYTTKCPLCKTKFVPRFTVTIREEVPEGVTPQVAQFRHEFLNPFILQKEISNLISKDVPANAALFTNHPTMAFNLLIHFKNLIHHLSFLLPQVNWKEVGENLDKRMKQV